MSKFGPAHAAQILRAEQKDDNFVGKLTKEMSQLLLTAMGPANLIKWQQFIEPTARYVLIFQSIKHWLNLLLFITFSRFLYLMSTTFSNYQTLGEEYTGILQFDHSKRTLPSKLSRLAFILAQTATPLVIKHLSSKLLGLSMNTKTFFKKSFYISIFSPSPCGVWCGLLAVWTEFQLWKMWKFL